jgi:hypothetical protein
LHIDFFVALEMPWRKLRLLYNESMRQRAINAGMTAQLFSKDASVMERLLKIHGEYTEGHVEEQLMALMGAFGADRK